MSKAFKLASSLMQAIPLPLSNRFKVASSQKRVIRRGGWETPMIGGPNFPKKDCAVDGFPNIK